MSKYSDYIKSMKKKDLEWFFGEDLKKTSNKYFEFTHFVDDDNIIILTSNILNIKNSYALAVGSNKAVFLKDWQVRPVHNYYENLQTYAVKLNRKYFKIYEFKSEFEQFYFEKDEDFDDLIKVAKEQDDANLKIAQGFMG